jgi:hypothetical protein
MNGMRTATYLPALPAKLRQASENAVTLAVTLDELAYAYEVGDKAAVRVVLSILAPLLAELGSEIAALEPTIVELGGRSF